MEKSKKFVIVCCIMLLILSLCPSSNYMLGNDSNIYIDIVNKNESQNLVEIALSEYRQFPRYTPLPIDSFQKEIDNRYEGRNTSGDISDNYEGYEIILLD